MLGKHAVCLDNGIVQEFHGETYSSSGLRNLRPITMDQNAQLVVLLIDGLHDCSQLRQISGTSSIHANPLVRQQELDNMPRKTISALALRGEADLNRLGGRPMCRAKAACRRIP